MATRKAAKAAKKTLPKTIKVGGRTRTKASCHTSKTAANKKAMALRGNGKNATVRKNPTGGYCVYSNSRKKK